MRRPMSWDSGVLPGEPQLQQQHHPDAAADPEVKERVSCRRPAPHCVRHEPGGARAGRTRAGPERVGPAPADNGELGEGAWAA